MKDCGVKCNCKHGPDWAGFFEGLLTFCITVGFILWVFGVFK